MKSFSSQEGRNIEVYYTPSSWVKKENYATIGDNI